MAAGCEELHQFENARQDDNDDSRQDAPARIGKADRKADEVKNFAPSLAKAIPNGPCFSPDGMLYIAEQNRVLVYPAAEFFYESPDVVAVNVIPQGELIPPEHESFNHTARVCRVGPDGKLYISLGQPYNVTPPELIETFQEVGIGGMIRVNQDGTGREVYTVGIRNSVGHDFHPETGELWFTDNQVDGMGDDQPPGEINRQTAAGPFVGTLLDGVGDLVGRLGPEHAELPGVPDAVVGDDPVVPEHVRAAERELADGRGSGRHGGARRRGRRDRGRRRGQGRRVGDRGRGGGRAGCRRRR